MKNRDRIFSLVLALFLASGLAACGTDASAKKLIRTANIAQREAVVSYDAAKAQERDASLKCAEKLREAGVAMPTKPEAVAPMCATIGAPLPYDPIKLQQGGGVLNALHVAIKTADVERVKLRDAKATGYLSGLILPIINGTAEVVRYFTEAAIKVPDKLRATIEELDKATKP